MGGGWQRVELDEACSLVDDRAAEVLAVHEALDKLAEESTLKAEFAKLRYFTGMSVEEAADAMGISRATGARYWSYAKVFLYCAMEDAK